jgi:N6-L-threonylcarbamoyladenine synthase
MSLILGIETSCDETAAALVESSRVVHANVIASQAELHAEYGGVFPEMASRQHIRDILPVIARAMAEAGADWQDLAGIAVTRGPGLAGSLLVGVNAAKGLALATGLPLVGVNHMAGHLYSNWLHVDGRVRTPALVAEMAAAMASAGPATAALDAVTGASGSSASVGAQAIVDPQSSVDPRTTTDSSPPFPHLLLTVSGGHTEIYHVRGHGQFECLGVTLDDAAGEAFDKAARLLGLGYPGGPEIQRVAAGGDPAAIRFPVAKTPEPLDFSFSGLKTAVLRQVQLAERDGRAPAVADIAAGFQAAVVRALCGRVSAALEIRPAEALLVAGGVAANAALRAGLVETISIPLWVPPNILCTDNAAMIAAAGYWAMEAGRRDDMTLDVVPGLALGEW